MKTTDQLRAERQGRPLQLGSAKGHGGGWMTDANGDLVETDPDEEDTTTELSTPENIAEMIEESNSNHQIEGSQNKTLT